MKLPEWIVDIRGKKSFHCPHCGQLITVQPRQINMNTLKHMQTVRQLAEKTKAKDTRAFENTRACICRSCGKTVICFDEFTTITEPKEKRRNRFSESVSVVILTPHSRLVRSDAIKDRSPYRAKPF